MAEEKELNDGPAQEGAQQKPKKGSKGLIIVIVMILAALAGGYVLYTQFFSGHASASKTEPQKEAKAAKSALLALDPFILNLAEQGRFLKVTMQFEIADAGLLPVVNDRMPQLRDAIITLVSSKSADALSSPEGKFQLKDDILLRANQAVGTGVTFKNLYFTEFVMQ